MQFIDYYAVLQIPNTSSAGEIKSAYKTLVKRFHPDINHNTDATIKMQLINEAYLILSDVEARQLFDAEWTHFYNKGQAKQTMPNETHQPSDTGSSYNQPGNSCEYESDILKDWITKAKQQAQSITAQALKDTGGMVKEAGKGISSSLGSIIGYIVFINLAYLIFLLIKGCH